jgi:hypothetical protein
MPKLVVSHEEGWAYLNLSLQTAWFCSESIFGVETPEATVKKWANWGFRPVGSRGQISTFDIPLLNLRVHRGLA